MHSCRKTDRKMWALLQSSAACKNCASQFSKELCQSMFNRIAVHARLQPSKHVVSIDVAKQHMLAGHAVLRCRHSCPAPVTRLASSVSRSDSATHEEAPSTSLPQTATGKVISQDAKFFRVRVEPVPGSADSSSFVPPLQQLMCMPRALLRKMGQQVLVGDHVQVSAIDWREGRGVVETIMKRSSELVDPAIANVDHVILLFALSQPPFEELQVSRFLVMVEAEGLPLTLVLNKSDIVPQEVVEARVRQCRSWGYEALPISCNNGTGLEELAKTLQGRTSVLAGPSGSGKSSLINALRHGRHRPDAAQLHLPSSIQENILSDIRPWQAPEECEGQASCSGAGSSAGFITVGEMSRVGRGRHTTRSVSLIDVPGGGLLADSPGFSQPALDSVSLQQLGWCFPEFRRRQEVVRCRFDNCLHLAEPGCAIMDQEFERWEHYVRFATEIQVREQMDEKFLQSHKQKREGNVKAKSQGGGKQRYEVRLNSKKHRRVSRSKEGDMGRLLDNDEVDDDSLVYGS